MGFFDRIRRLRNRIKEFADGRFLYVIITATFYFVLHGVSFGSYFDYDFCRKSHYERKKYLGERERSKIEKKYNNDKSLLSDKARFNDLFFESLKRDYLYVLKADFNDFVSFVDKHNSFIIKRNWLCEGRGVEKFSTNKNVDITGLYNKLKNEDALIEEIIVQHNEMQKLNPSSVNTVRIATWYSENGVTVVAASLRVGCKDSCTDNLHSGGYACSVDVSTGVVQSLAFNGEAHNYIRHPDTGEILIGFQIPYWREAIEAAVSCAKKTPNNKWVGWDIAILPDGVAVVEGNINQAIDLLQINSKGLKPTIKRLQKQ